MHHFIFPSQDSWISSGSRRISSATNTSERNANFGRDQILELKKHFFNESFDYQTRALLQFDLSEISKSMVRGVSTGGRTKDIKSPKFYLRLYEAQGNKELSTEYKIAAFPISQSWDEGRGKFEDNPKVTDGVSWENRNNKPGATATTWSNATGTSTYGVSIYTGSWNASQSFSYQSPDVEMNVTDIVNSWLNKDISNNYGFLLKFSGSQETDNATFGQLKFFSSKTHTVYSPRLEVRWDDHVIVTGSATGSLLPLTMSGEVDNILYMKYFRDSYRENEKVKFRVGARKRYIQKSFSTSVQTLTGSYIAEGSGSYSIIDIASGETVVPFSAYTSMSCDSTSNYFTQWLNGFYPNRIYKILFKLKYDDNQEIIYDDDFEFKVVR